MGINSGFKGLMTLSGAGLGFVGAWNLYSFWSPLWGKEYKSRYESEYLFRKRKKSQKYKFKKADKYHKHHKIQKNNIF